MIKVICIRQNTGRLPQPVLGVIPLRDYNLNTIGII